MDWRDGLVGVDGAMTNYLVHAVEDRREGIFDWHVLCWVSGSCQVRNSDQNSVDLPIIVLAKSGKVHLVHIIAHSVHQSIIRKIAMLLQFLSRYCHYLVERRKPV